MIVRITAKRAGFRRCGIAHPAQPVDHPADRFTAAELERLQAEPMLKVVVLDGEPGQPLAPLPDDAYPADSVPVAVEVAEAPAESAPADKHNAKAGAKAPAKAGK
jgi:hypothetical protein